MTKVHCRNGTPNLRRHIKNCVQHPKKFVTKIDGQTNVWTRLKLNAIPLTFSQGHKNRALNKISKDFLSPLKNFIHLKMDVF